MKQLSIIIRNKQIVCFYPNAGLSHKCITNGTL